MSCCGPSQLETVVVITIEMTCGSLNFFCLSTHVWVCESPRHLSSLPLCVNEAFKVGSCFKLALFCVSFLSHADCFKTFLSNFALAGLLPLSQPLRFLLLTNGITSFPSRLTTTTPWTRPRQRWQRGALWWLGAEFDTPSWIRLVSQQKEIDDVNGIGKEVN